MQENWESEPFNVIFDINYFELYNKAIVNKFKCCVDISKYNIDKVSDVYIKDFFFNKKEKVQWNYDKAGYLYIDPFEIELKSNNTKLVIKCYSRTLYRNKILNEIFEDDSNI
jgi:hypothetical protein